jgi:hypothetical protein
MKFKEKKDVEEFYDRFGSEHFQMQSKVLRGHGTQAVDIFFRSVGFVIQVLGIIGVIAGFGFTAYSFVQSKILFFIGEGVLLYTIIYGIIWVQKIYAAEFKTSNNTMKKFADFFEKRNKHFMEKIYPDATQKYEVKDEEFKKLMEIDNEMLVIFKPDPLKDASQIPLYPKNLYRLLMVGAGFLLVSFIINSILFFIACIWSRL